MRLSKLFRINEMARPRGEAMWAVLDWAAQQPGLFTIKDMQKVYHRSGGGGDSQGAGSFATAVNKLIAKPWKDDEVKYALSDTRPILAVSQGSRGGNATLYKWGLDHPLREPQDAPDPDGLAGDDEGTAAIGDAFDRLEGMMGRDALKSAISRWKTMQPHQVVADVKKSVPKAGQLDAVHIAMDALTQSGKADDSDVEDAEAEVQQSSSLPDAPGAAKQRPDATAAAAGPMTPMDLPEPPMPEPEEEPSDDGEEGDDEEDASQGGLTLPRFSKSEPPTAPPTSKPKSPLSKLWKKK